MQAIISIGLGLFAIGALLFVLRRVIPLPRSGGRILTRLALAAWLAAVVLIVATVAIGLIGHAIVFPEQ